MKKIFCDLHLFNLEHNVYVIDLDNNSTELITTVSIEELPEIISAVCHSRNIDNILLQGNSIYSSAIAEDIIAYSKINYNKNNLEIEVVK